MIKLLEQLNQLPGVVGSMVLTDDGIAVESLLAEKMDEECVAAFSSAVHQAVKRASTRCGDGTPDELILEAEQGNLLLVGLGGATLAVMTHAGLEVNTGLLEIRSLARRLRGVLEIRTS